MARILRLPKWVMRAPQPSTPNGSGSEEARTHDIERPEIGRGRVTSFHRFREVDAIDLLRWGKHADPLLESYNMDLATREDSQRWFNMRMSWVDAQLYAVKGLKEQRVIGYIGLREINVTNRTSVLGISFDPALVGRGYGLDALQTFLRYYFECWNYASMFLDVAATNFRAQRCYERCGYQYLSERWKPFTGSVRRAIQTQTFIQYPEFFQFNGRQLNQLFYDMRITREGWLERNRLPASEQPAR